MVEGISAKFGLPYTLIINNQVPKILGIPFLAVFYYSFSNPGENNEASRREHTHTDPDRARCMLVRETPLKMFFDQILKILCHAKDRIK